MSDPPREVNKPVEAKRFMSEVDIKIGFVSGNSQKFAQNETLSDLAKQRLQSTTPVNKFFTVKQMSKRKKKPYFYAGKGYVDLRKDDSPVETQWGGTCTAWGLKGVIDNLAKTRTSPRHIWSAYRQYSCEAAIQTWTNGKCITLDSKWPAASPSPLNDYLDEKYCNTYPKNVTYIDDDINRMKESLDRGNPVYLGITVTNSMANCDSTLSVTSYATNGGHALAIVGYKDDEGIKGGGYFIVKNSWGSDCGDRGYQYVPYNYCSRKDMYCIMWTIDKVTTNVVVPSDPSLPEEQTCLEWKRIWYKPWAYKCTKWKVVAKNI